MNDINKVYGELVNRCLDGETVQTRNSRCRRCFAEKITFTQTPLVSVRRTAWKNALREMEWFLSGSTQLNDLHPNVRPWWEPWATGSFLGGRFVPFNYSKQFRRATSEDSKPVDQIQLLIDGVKNHPNSRRNLITTWNAADMASEFCPITNCHGTVIQAFVDGANRLHLVTYQRSADVICGLPHNWIQYWALLLWLAGRCNLGVGTLTWMGGDIHVYEQHSGLANRIALACAHSSLREVPGLAYTAPDREQEFRADHFSLSGDYAPLYEDRAEMVV